MLNWSPQDWALFLPALVAAVTAVIAAYGTFLAKKAKTQGEENSQKIDANTKITKAGIVVADKAARVAAGAATEAKEATESMAADVSKKLNGGLDHAVNSAMGPVREAIARRDDLLESVVDRLKAVEEHQHRWDRDIRVAIDAQNARVEVILDILKRKYPEAAGGGDGR